MKKEFIRQNVGIDIAKDDFKVMFMGMQADLQTVVRGSHSFANNEKGFMAFVDWATQKAGGQPVNFTMEATGVYYESLAYFLFEQGLTVHVVLPNQSKKYGQSLGEKSKTDKIDARILAQMGLERRLREWKPVSGVLRILKQLTRERDTLEYYERLKEKKGKGMIAAVATQRKLLGLMYTLWKKEEAYRAAV